MYREGPEEVVHLLLSSLAGIPYSTLKRSCSCSCAIMLVHARAKNKGDGGVDVMILSFRTQIAYCIGTLPLPSLEKKGPPDLAVAAKAVQLRRF